MEFFIGALVGIALGATAVWLWFAKAIQRLKDVNARLADKGASVRQRELIVDQRDIETRALQTELDEAVANARNRRIRYETLVRENESLKKDLFHYSIKTRKQDRDRAAIEQHHQRLQTRLKNLLYQYMCSEIRAMAVGHRKGDADVPQRRLDELLEEWSKAGLVLDAVRRRELYRDLEARFRTATRESGVRNGA